MAQQEFSQVYVTGEPTLPRFYHKCSYFKIPQKKGKLNNNKENNVYNIHAYVINAIYIYEALIVEQEKTENTIFM